MWQDDLPCQFSREESIANASFVREIVGAKWLARTCKSPRITNYLAQRWTTRGAEAFLELNALAQDLRALESAKNVDVVIRDLRDSDRCQPAWFTLHVGAMLGRAEGQDVEEFYAATDETVPDFALAVRDITIPIEAKRMGISDQERAFNSYAAKVAQEVTSQVLSISTSHPTIVVIIKQVQSLPRIEEVVSAVRNQRRIVGGGGSFVRGGQFNVLFDPYFGAGANAGSTSICCVVAPRSEVETPRTQGRAKKASKQLAAASGGKSPTALCIALSEHQDAAFAAGLFNRRFHAGQYSGMSGVMMVKTGLVLTPPLRQTIDAVTTLRNEKSTQRMPDLQIVAVGELVSMGVDPDPTTTSAYRSCVAQANLSGGGELRIPNMERIPNEWLS